MQELAGERAELKAAQRQLRHEHVQLLKDKATTQDKLAELQQKAVDVQMLKFGQVLLIPLGLPIAAFPAAVLGCFWVQRLLS